MSDENCYILTSKMVQFVLIAREAITDGVTGANCGELSEMFWKNDFQHEIKDKCCGHVVNIITGDHI